jgi:general secretion pathway protein B
MSFILDALKKSESERSRQTGPVLMDVRIAAPKRRLPAWIWVIGGVLIANLALLGFLLLRKPSPRATAAATPTVTAAVPAASTAAPALPAPAMPIAAPPPAVDATIPPATITPVLQTPAATALPLTAPAFVPEPAPTQTAASAIDDTRLPTAQDLAVAGITLPNLQLNLHVYDTNPANRYVLLNGVRLHEGEFTAEGIKLERITATGLVLESNGRRFRLSAGG